MKTYIQYGIITALIIIIIICFTQYAKADSVNLSYVNTDYSYSFPANVIFDDQSNGYNLTYGLDLNPNWQLDLGYADLGSATQPFLFVNTEVDTTAWSLALHGSTAIGAIAGHTIKGHVLFGVMKADMDISIGANTLNDSDTGLLYGVGASVWLSPVDAIVAKFKKTKLTFNNSVNFDYDPMMIEIGYTRRF